MKAWYVRLTIDGVAELRPARHHVVTDRVVSATYLASGLITGGEVRVSTPIRAHGDAAAKDRGDGGVSTYASGRRRTGPQISGPVTSRRCRIRVWRPTTNHSSRRC